MTALPIGPTDDQLYELWRGTNAERGIVDCLHALFEAGVEAERARAAAETTEEWAIEYPGLGARYGTEQEVRDAHAQTGFPIARRIAAGPWEVQS